uniref:Uncharacterized protein n=1 Tax=viral metagenome TaxID=1070528 RepID=A0A6C0CCV8_9ZZZZ
MNSQLINTNPLINRFNGYATQNPNTVHFQSNQLINQNPHISNHLNDFIRQHNHVQQNVPAFQQQINNRPEKSVRLPSNKKNAKKNNIIEEMLKPQKIEKENKDVITNLKERENKQNTESFEITNDPYKNIIKDKIIKKPWDKIKEADLIVHTVTPVDRDKNRFEKEVNVKKEEKKQINKELKIEFHIDNYSNHKDAFEYNKSFIKNLAYNSKDFDENKGDYIEFYRKHQKEAEEGQELCDKILHDMVDSGLIKPEELPTNNSENL